MPKMTRPMPNWRNAYKGIPPRPWLHLQLLGENGLIRELQLLADTGNPYPLIISSKNMASFQQGFSPDIDEAFKMGMTALSGHDNRIACITQNQTAKTKSWDRHPDPATFHWAEIGLNARWFWLRSPAKTSH
jgi:hypothetical protein